jgi:hypothetical protein
MEAEVMGGQGGYVGLNLESEQSVVRISGSACAQVCAEKILGVIIRGAGTVQYRGEPRIR